MSIRTSIREADALIIGGGPAGAATACHLARRGASVALFEQSSAPSHKVCGEFLSVEAVAYLQELGIAPQTLGALPICGVRLSTKTITVAAELPFRAFSLSRRRLDEELLTLANRYGAKVQRGHRVDSLTLQSGEWQATLADGSTFRARSAFLATGKQDLRGFRRPQIEGQEFVAFKMYWHLTQREEKQLREWVEVFLFPGGYAGLQMAEDSMANLCLLIQRRVLHRFNGDWMPLLTWIQQYSRPLAKRLEGATPLLARPLAVSSIPYGLLRASSDEGLWLLGDQTAVIPSFSGEGISIALHSAKIASALYAGGETPDRLASLLHRQLLRPMVVARVLAKLMMAAPDLAILARTWPHSLRCIACHTRIPRVALETRAESDFAPHC